MSHPYESSKGREALKKMRLAFDAGQPPELRLVAALRICIMRAATLAWLDAQWPGLMLDRFPGAGWSVCIFRPDTPDSPELVKEILSEAPTIDEALIAAVNATPARQPVGREGE